MDWSTAMTTSAAIALPFSFDPSGAVFSSQDTKKIIQDRVVLAIMTYKKERVNRPTFGTLVRGVTFENQNTASTIITQEVSSGFSNLLPYLTLISTDIFIDVDSVLNVSVTYKYGIGTQPETVSVKVATLSGSGEIITEA
jgi:phage baseplate assembly protein W